MCIGAQSLCIILPAVLPHVYHVQHGLMKLLRTKLDGVTPVGIDSEKECDLYKVTVANNLASEFAHVAVMIFMRV